MQTNLRSGDFSRDIFVTKSVGVLDSRPRAHRGAKVKDAFATAEGYSTDEAHRKVLEHVTSDAGGGQILGSQERASQKRLLAFAWSKDSRCLERAFATEGLLISTETRSDRQGF